MRKLNSSSAKKHKSQTNKRRSHNQNSKRHHSKPQGRKMKVNLAKQKASKVKKRKLFIEMLLDLIGLPNYNIHPTYMPLSIPQISDARITVQTFNPPSMPLTPGMMPKPEYHFNVKIPEQPAPPKHSKAFNVAYTGKYDGDMKALMMDAFESAFGKHKKLHSDSNIQDQDFLLNVVSSDSEKHVDDIRAKQRMNNIINRVKKMASLNEDFNNQVNNKLKFLDFLLKKYYQIKLNLIMG